jgi:hypothetical protein
MYLLFMETFLGLKWQHEMKVPFGPKKSRFSGPTPFQWPEEWMCRIKIVQSKRHIKNKYTGNFMYMSFRAHRCQWPSLP